MKRGVWLFPVVLVLALALPVRAEDMKPLPKVETKAGGDHAGFRELTPEEAEKLVGIESRPVRSPITGQIVHMPLEDPKSTDLDSDLCPHPVGKVSFYSPIVLDPHSGFAAYRQHFEQPQSPEIKAWVKRHLTPRFQRVLSGLVGDMGRKDPEVITRFFSKQEHLPDVIRCEHALAFYTHIKATPAVRARLAWLCAWAYRREVCETLEGPYLMNNIRKIVRAMSDEKIDTGDLQERINRLAALYEQKDDDGNNRFTYAEQQLIRVILAGYYTRIGARTWAKACLEAVARNASEQKTYADVEADPWAQGVGGAPEQRATVVALQRKAIYEMARARLVMLEKEAKYLALAAKLLREGIANGEYPPDKTAFFIYLVGEFERRQENFGAAKIWLKAASLLLNEGGESNYAAKQLDMLKDYAMRCKADLNADYATRTADVQELTRQIDLIRRARGGNAEELRTSAPSSANMPSHIGQRPPNQVSIPERPE